MKSIKSVKKSFKIDVKGAFLTCFWPVFGPILGVFRLEKCKSEWKVDKALGLLREKMRKSQKDDEM